MALLPCPECKAEISSHARFCPRCGYPFEQKQESITWRGAETLPRVRRPFGVFLGVSMCVIGTLLLLSRFLIMLPFYFRYGLDSMLGQSAWQFSPMGQLAWSSPVWQIFGLMLLCLGIVQLIFGSTKKERTAFVP